MRNKIRVTSVILEGLFLMGLCYLFGISSNEIIRIVCVYWMIQAIFGHYSIKTLLIWDEVDLLVKSFLCFFFTLILFCPWNGSFIYSCIRLFFISFIMLGFTIILQRHVRHWFRSSCADRVLIIGCLPYAEQVAFICRGNRFALKDVKGFVPLDGKDWSLENVFKLEDLETKIQELHINNIVIAAPNYSRHKMKDLLKRIEIVDKVSYIPLVDGINFDSHVDDFDGKLLVTTSEGEIGFVESFIKRCIDICAGIAGCLLLIPLTLFVFISNRKEGDHDPLFFVQERIGKDGRLFKMYKYRSMVPNAERVLEDLMDKDPAIREEYLTNKKLKDDPRITKAGKFLREKSFDEFPQFINLLKGDMSLIGPRPYLPREIDDMGDYYKFVIGCKPGITGMWQTHGRNDTDFEERLILDQYYNRNWSLKLDLTILIKTFKTVFYGS